MTAQSTSHWFSRCQVVLTKRLLFLFFSELYCSQFELLSFVTILVWGFSHNSSFEDFFCYFSYWVFVAIWVFYITVLSFVAIWVLKICHNLSCELCHSLSFWVLSQFVCLSFVTTSGFWVVAIVNFEFCHNLSLIFFL